jgi:hypothetical protein
MDAGESLASDVEHPAPSGNQYRSTAAVPGAVGSVASTSLRGWYQASTPSARTRNGVDRDVTVPK